MNVYHIQHPHSLTSETAACIAFGNFDGLHTGHQYVIQQALHLAHEKGLHAGVMTFYPHPKEVLGRVEKATYITPIEDKLHLFEQLGLDLTYVVQFDPSFSQLSPAEFIQQYIIDLNIKYVICGFDFCFGKQGQGTVATLKQVSKDTGAFDVHEVSKIKYNEDKISSSHIRNLLQEGAVKETIALLKRPFRLCGVVEHGEKKGRTIGFPTANIRLTRPYIVPRQGVYAVEVKGLSKSYYGVVNIGTRPTVSNDDVVSIEVHLFDFNEDIYGKALCLDFIDFIRPERRFNSLDELKNQISIDAEKARHILSAHI